MRLAFIFQVVGLTLNCLVNAGHFIMAESSAEMLFCGRDRDMNELILSLTGLAMTAVFALQTVEIVHFWEDSRACFHQSHYSYYSHLLRLRRAALLLIPCLTGCNKIGLKLK